MKLSIARADWRRGPEVQARCPAISSPVPSARARLKKTASLTTVRGPIVGLLIPHLSGPGGIMTIREKGSRPRQYSCRYVAQH